MGRLLLCLAALVAAAAAAAGSPVPADEFDASADVVAASPGAIFRRSCAECVEDTFCEFNYPGAPEGQVACVGLGPEDLHGLYRRYAEPDPIPPSWGTETAMTIIGNMPQTNDNGFTGSLNSVTVRTFKITLAATARCRITSVVMRLASSSATMPTVQIRDDVGTSNPGSTVLDALVSPSRSGSSAVDYTYTPRNASTVYDEGSSFWLFATGGSAAWQSSSPGKGYSGVATAAANRYSGDSGASYTNSFFLQTFRINGACQILS